jgi:hypothetical protein
MGKVENMKRMPVALEAEERPSEKRDQGTVDEYTYLLGRPMLKEFLDFVEGEVVDGRSADRRALIEEWTSANNYIRILEEKEAGWADNPKIDALPGHLHPLRDEFLTNPLIQHSFRSVPIEIGVVELDRLVVYQKHINLDFVRSLTEKIGEAPGDEDLFRACLPSDRTISVARCIRTRNDTYQFLSPSNDLRFLGPMLLNSENITGQPTPGALVGMVGLAVGFGSNVLNVVQAENRLVLNNGSHRAFTLRQMGITHVPCLIQQVSSREELMLVGSAELRKNPDRYLLHPRPSLFKDYFEPRLRKVFPVIRQLRQVRVNFTVEENYVPAV